MGVVERIRSLAAQNGHTIASVERVCGLSQGSIRKWDHAAPSADKLYKVAQMFNVTMEYLLIGGLQSTSQSEDTAEIHGISDDALRVACLWDSLDVPGKAIILGDIYRRAEALADGQRDDRGERRRVGT